MAEERTLGLVRAQEQPVEDLSKEELQRRLEETRDSISHTVTEIKDTVANQVQAVKESLDWREQFKKRPIIWSVGAMGVGFLAGYGIAAALKGGRNYHEEAIDYYGAEARSYAAQPILGQPPVAGPVSETGREEESGPGILERLANSSAYSKVRQEAGSVGDALIQEIGKTAKMLIVPAVINSIKGFVGAHLPRFDTNQKPGNGKQDRSAERSGYQPVLEHNQD